MRVVDSADLSYPERWGGSYPCVGTLRGSWVTTMKNIKSGCRAAQSVNHSEAARLFVAQQHFEQGNFDACLEAAGSLLGEASDHLPSLELIAKCQWKQGQFEEALHTIDRLVALNPYEPGYFLLRGAACEGLGLVGDAIAAYRRCLVNPDSAAAKTAATELPRLLEWQARTLTTLLEEDRCFRIAYDRNPEEACKSRGFQFIEPREVRLLRLIEPSFELSWARPS